MPETDVRSLTSNPADCATREPPTSQLVDSPELLMCCIKDRIASASVVQKFSSQSQKMVTANRFPASLTGLPVELFECIVQRLATHDLKSLRRVNRQAASKVLGTYTQALFAHQAYYMTLPESLQLAIDVSSHPAFGSALRKLTFLVEDVTHRTYTADPERYMPPLKNANSVEKITAAWKRGGAVPNLLNRLFKILKRNGRLEEIELVDHIATTLQPAGQPSHPLAFEAPAKLKKPSPVPLLYLLFALEETNLKIPSLKVRGSRWGMPLEKAWTFFDNDKSAFTSLFSSLRHLSIYFAYHHPEGNTHSFLWALKKSPHLKILEWAGNRECIDCPHRAWMHNIPQSLEGSKAVLAQDFIHLEELRLTFLHVWEDRLVEFVKRHEGRALRRIRLTDATIGFGRFGWRLETPEKLLARLRMLVGEKSRVQLSLDWSQDWTRPQIPLSQMGRLRPDG